MATFRHLMPVARRINTVSPSWRGTVQQVRGKKDMPLWPGRHALRPYRRDWPWEDPFFQNFLQNFGPRSFEQQMKNAVEQMNRFASRTFDWPTESHGENAEIVQAKIDKEGMNIKINVSHYEPEELNVKVVGDRLVISGKHEKKSDEYSFVSREFTREFLIPEEVERDSIASRFTEDGHLVISARVKQQPVEEGRTINIENEKPKKDPEGNKSS